MKLNILAFALVVSAVPAPSFASTSSMIDVSVVSEDENGFQISTVPADVCSESPYELASAVTRPAYVRSSCDIGKPRIRQVNRATCASIEVTPQSEEGKRDFQAVPFDARINLKKCGARKLSTEFKDALYQALLHSFQRYKIQLGNVQWL